jgi:hypothetical protein
MKIILIIAGLIGTITVVAVQQMDPKTPIVRQMETRHGSLSGVSVESMTTWFSQGPNQKLAAVIAQECNYSSYRANNIRWSDTTEGHICRAAVPVAAFGITTNWAHN